MDRIGGKHLRGLIGLVAPRVGIAEGCQIRQLPECRRDWLQYLCQENGEIGAARRSACSRRRFAIDAGAGQPCRYIVLERSGRRPMVYQLSMDAIKISIGSTN